MGKKIVVLATLLFISISSFIGCAKTHVYTSEYFKIFEKDIKVQYPNINKVQVTRLGIEIRINYILNNFASSDDIEELFKTTVEYANKKSFGEAIIREDKAERNSLGRATMVVTNPDPNKKNDTREISYALNIKKWYINM